MSRRPPSLLFPEVTTPFCFRTTPLTGTPVPLCSHRGRSQPKFPRFYLPWPGPVPVGPSPLCSRSSVTSSRNISYTNTSRFRSSTRTQGREGSPPRHLWDTTQDQGLDIWGYETTVVTGSSTERRYQGSVWVPWGWSVEGTDYPGPPSPPLPFPFLKPRKSH